MATKAELAHMARVNTCTIQGCDNKHYAKGYCTKHYQRVLANGSPHIAPKPTSCIVDGCAGKARSWGLCSKHYMRQRAHGDTSDRRIIGNDKARLIANSFVNDTGCWIWLKSKYDGYGRTIINGKTTSAHRASWIAFVGNIPDGKQVNHKCHVRSCINPDHLYIGDQKQNMDDMRLSGREVKVRGSASGVAKLDENRVSIIKHLLCNRSAESVAKEFSVSPSCIRFIKHGKTWKHVQ